MVSGKPGSGIEQVVAQIVDELDERQIACEALSDEHFRRAAFDCQFCPQQGGMKGCRDSPQSLDSGLFFEAIRMTVQRVQNSERFGAGNPDDYPNGRGVVVIQGSLIFHEASVIKLLGGQDLVGRR